MRRRSVEHADVASCVIVAHVAPCVIVTDVAPCVVINVIYIIKIQTKTRNYNRIITVFGVFRVDAACVVWYDMGARTGTGTRHDDDDVTRHGERGGER